MNQIKPLRYSLLDPDLPLLAIDAAYEIDELIAQSESAARIQPKSQSLKLSTDLVSRLKQISEANQVVTADSELFCHSLLPQIKNDNISLPTEPVSLNAKLYEVMKSYDPSKSKDDLQNIRDFFIAVSDFSLNAQRWSRSNSYT